MLPGYASSPALGGKDQSVTLLRHIRNSIWIICAVHIVLFITAIGLISAILYFVRYYKGYLHDQLSGPRLRDMTLQAHGIVDDVKTVTGIIAIVTQGMAPNFGNVTVLGTPPAAGSRRSLLMDPALASSLAKLVETANGKLATLDLEAPMDLLRYVMDIRWRADIAPYVTQVLATVERAETFAGSVLRALGTTIDASVGPGWWLTAPPGAAAAAVGKMVGH